MATVQELEAQRALAVEANKGLHQELRLLVVEYRKLRASGIEAMELDREIEAAASKWTQLSGHYPEFVRHRNVEAGKFRLTDNVNKINKVLDVEEVINGDYRYPQMIHKMWVVGYGARQILESTEERITADIEMAGANSLAIRIAGVGMIAKSECGFSWEILRAAEVRKADRTRYGSSRPISREGAIALLSQIGKE